MVPVTVCLNYVRLARKIEASLTLTCDLGVVTFRVMAKKLEMNSLIVTGRLYA